MLENKLNRALSASILRLLRPLVRILLRNGVAYGSFTELARKVYVDVAFEEFAPKGKKQTVSRVSAMTGLTRKEVKRLLEMEGPVDPASRERFNRGVRVISGWLHDKRFHDAGGKPADLPVDSKRNSFADLVKEYSGDIPTKAMLTMLEEAGNVRQVKGKVRLVRHAYVPGNDPVDMLQILGTDVGELIATIDHNLTAGPDDLLFQRKVAYDSIDPAAVAKLKKMSFKKAQALLEQLDRQFSRHELETESDDGGKYISLGIYYYERDSKEE
ncbi:MAG: DUF6502 family protein [Gammaproteobacteria bacterium]|nr:DUF6502 family protein [Gammaproteobacteria bacterium]MDH3561181.1 DUF6502 family protein [Gammaproteobacteria bacterium]